MSHLSAHRCPGFFPGLADGEVAGLDPVNDHAGFGASCPSSCILASPILHRLPGQSHW